MQPPDTCANSKVQENIGAPH